MRKKKNPYAMLTVQCRFTAKMLKDIDKLIRKGIYSTRSETVRDAVRKLTMKK